MNISSVHYFISSHLISTLGEKSAETDTDVPEFSGTLTIRESPQAGIFLKSFWSDKH